MSLKYSLILSFIFSANSLIAADEVSQIRQPGNSKSSRISTSLQNSNNNKNSPELLVNAGRQFQGFYIGVVGNTLLSPFKKTVDGQDITYNMYGIGICFEYTAYTWSNYSLNTEAIIAVNKVNARGEGDKLTSTQIRTFKPGISLGYQADNSSSMLSLELGYTKASKFHWQELSHKDMNGYYAGIKVSTSIY